MVTNLLTWLLSSTALIHSTSGFVGQHGSRRRTGYRPKTNVHYGLPSWAWYCIAALIVVFVLILVAAVIYYVVVLRKRRRERKESEKYKPLRNLNMSKEQQRREMERYLAKNPVKVSDPYHEYDDEVDGRKHVI